MAPSVLQELGKDREGWEANSSIDFGNSKTTRPEWESSPTGEFRSLVKSVVEFQGESVILNPEQMEDGTPYLITLLDRSLVAIKHPDGTIDFFHLPSE